MQQDKPVSKTKQVPCPTCRTLSDFIPQNAYRPFCSERCKMIDLGEWANENYKIPDKSPARDFEEPD